MSKELYWLTLTALMTAVFWVPYVLNRMLEIGIVSTMFDSNADLTAKAPWAKRLMAAHRNAVENLVVFAALVTVVQISGTATALTAKAAAIYFFARLIHAIVYTLGVPGVRTLSFLVGCACQVILGITALGWL